MRRSTLARFKRLHSTSFQKWALAVRRERHAPAAGTVTGEINSMTFIHTHFNDSRNPKLLCAMRLAPRSFRAWSFLARASTHKDDGACIPSAPQENIPSKREKDAGVRHGRGASVIIRVATLISSVSRSWTARAGAHHRGRHHCADAIQSAPLSKKHKNQDTKGVDDDSRSKTMQRRIEDSPDVAMNPSR